MCDKRLLLSLLDIQVFLFSVHVLGKNLAVEIRYRIEELLYFVPNFFVPGGLFVHKGRLFFLLLQKIVPSILISRVGEIIGRIFAINAETWVLVNVVFVLDIVPSANL